MSYLNKTFIANEFARRANQFHSGENPMSINLWGLFRWEDISHLIKKGDIIPNSGFTEENVTIWCKPSLEFYNKYIKHLIK